MSLTVKQDAMQKLMRSLHALTGKTVLVGIPSTETDRKESGQAADNAMLGYIHEFGAPAANIPARPFLIPGVAAAAPTINDRLRKAAAAAVSGDAAAVHKHMSAAGMAAASSAKNLINAGIWPELSESTLKARARRGRKGAAQELANRAADSSNVSVDLAKPLVDTGQLRNAITYVIRKK